MGSSKHNKKVEPTVQPETPSGSIPVAGRKIPIGPEAVPSEGPDVSPTKEDQVKTFREISKKGTFETPEPLKDE